MVYVLQKRRKTVELPHTEKKPDNVRRKVIDTGRWQPHDWKIGGESALSSNERQKITARDIVFFQLRIPVVYLL